MRRDNFFDYFIDLVWQHKLLAFFIIFGVLLRINHFDINYYHSHDQDLEAWIILDILSGHIRLIGQQTSQLGVFIGPLFYYSLIPFYLVTNLNPLGTAYFIALISLLSTGSIYFVFNKVFGKKTALISTFLYALNFSAVLTDREVVPTVIVFLWSVWFMYSLHLLLRGDKKGLVLLGIMMGLVWHINLALGLLLPVSILAIVLSGKKTKLSQYYLVLIPFLVLMAPFIIFELRHGFIQTASVLEGFTSVDKAVPLSDKFSNVIRLVTNNVNYSFLGKRIYTRELPLTIALLAALLAFIYKKIIDRKLGILFLSWLALFIIFFTLNNIILSEYYLNGMQVVWFSIVSVLLAEGLKYKLASKIVIILLVLYGFYNIQSYMIEPINRSGYKDRRDLADFIKQDAQEHDYPCVAVSYITKPGLDLGYRYVFYMNKMHVNYPKSGSPVYSVVFPHSMVDRLDKTFGAIGLVLPDYERYTPNQVQESCSGENSNEVDSLFGYTE